LFPVDEKTQVIVEFTNFSDGREGLGNLYSIVDREKMDPKAWWLVHGTRAPLLQMVTLSYLNSLNPLRVVKEIGVQMAPNREEGLIYVHSNLRLLSRNTPQYH